MDIINVLDKGFVRLHDRLGDDHTVAQAARVSYGSPFSTRERDKKLIFYLMEHGHESPFEHVVFTFHVKAPLFVARQWFRHRLGSYNEVSGRYTEIADEFYLPDNIRVNDKEDKQKSVIVDSPEALNQMRELMEASYKVSYNAYLKMLEMGIAKEEARIVLPLSTYTQWYWTVNFRSLMNFLNLRADSHAQFEIQQYALAIAKLVKTYIPISFEAFLKYNYKGDLLKSEE